MRYPLLALLVLIFSDLAGCQSISRTGRLCSGRTQIDDRKQIASEDTSNRLLSTVRTEQSDHLQFINSRLIEKDAKDTSFGLDMPLTGVDESNSKTMDLTPESCSQSRGTLTQRLLNDQKNYYSGDSLLGLGGAFVIGGIFANTQADQQLYNHFQSSVAGATSDEWFEFLHANKELGEGFYTLPIMGAAWLTGEVFDESPTMSRIGDWGERSLRGFVVGAPPLIAMQLVTGASRPEETPEGSQWRPFRDNNGVSGHAFMSSLPFITAAKMTDDPFRKSLWYLGSALGPLSRVNDNAHYPSQIGLGWAMAFFAATAIEQTERGDSQWRLRPLASSAGSGMALEYQW